MQPLSDRFLDFQNRRPPEVAPLLRQAGLLAFVGLLLAAATVGVDLSLNWMWGMPLVPLTMLLFLRAGTQLWRALQTRRVWNQVRRTARRGVTVTACVVRAHDDLYRPGTVARPCRVVFSFEPDVNADAEYLRYVARRWSESQSDSDRFCHGRRERIPVELTDGYTVYCADMIVPPGYLTRGYLSTGLLTCVAEPGEQGGIELVPYWLLFPFYMPVQPGEGQRV